MLLKKGELGMLKEKYNLKKICFVKTVEQHRSTVCNDKTNRKRFSYE